MGKIPVLFVDDEMIVRVALNSIVNWSNTEFNIAGTVSNGKEAIEFIEQNQVLLVVTDLKMPEMDGIELVKILSERNYKGKIIILTSFGEFEYARQAIQYGVSEYLLKATFTPQMLLDAMRNALRNITMMEEIESFKVKASFEETEVRKMVFDINYKPEKSENALHSDYVAYYIFKKERYSAKEDKEKLQNKGNPELLVSLIQEAILMKEEFTAIPLSGTEAVLIIKVPINRTAGNESNLEHSFLRLRNSARIYMNTDVGIVKSNYFSTKDQMCFCLRACIDLAKIKLYVGFQNVITQEQATEFCNELKKGSYQNIKEICSLVLKGDLVQAIDTVKKTLSDLLNEKIMIGQATGFIEKMFECFFLSWSFYFENQRSIVDEIKIQYQNSETIDEYIKIIQRWIEEIAESPLKNRSSFYRPDIRKIMEYINVHFEEKILLTDLAEVVNFTESYISRLFKNEVGINLLSYINMLKMEKGLLELLDKDILVKEVANHLNFEEQSYFNKTFNRYFGKNPSEIQEYFANMYK
jgi:two-component system response regulator YesN